MPEVREISSLSAYQTLIAGFQQAVTAAGHHRHAEFAEEMSANDPHARRFLAFAGNVVAGWMILTPSADGDSVKIEGISTHTDAGLKKGVLKALVSHAVSISLAERHRGIVSLTDMSSDGGSAYRFLGFVPEGGDPKKLRLYPMNHPMWRWVESGSDAISKCGKKIEYTGLALKEKP
jgi:hypothetical protein